MDVERVFPSDIICGTQPPKKCSIEHCNNISTSSTKLCHDCFVRTRGTPEQIGRDNANGGSDACREADLINVMLRGLCAADRLIAFSGFCKDCGIETNGRACHCENDE